MIVGSVRADEALSLSEFKERTKLSRHSMAGLRAAGLPVRRVGKCGYILGRDWIEFLSRVPADERIACSAVPAK